MKIKSCILIFGLLLPVSTVLASERIHWHCDFKDKANGLDPKNEMAFRPFNTICTEDGKVILRKAGCESTNEYIESDPLIIESQVKVRASAGYTNCANFKLNLIKSESDEGKGKIVLQEICPSKFHLKKIPSINEARKNQESHNVEFGEYGEENICFSGE